MCFVTCFTSDEKLMFYVEYELGYTHRVLFLGYTHHIKYELRYMLRDVFHIRYKTVCCMLSTHDITKLSRNMRNKSCHAMDSSVCEKRMNQRLRRVCLPICGVHETRGTP